MSPLLVGLIVAVASYGIIVLLFPRTVPKAESDYTRHALDRLYEENWQRDYGTDAILKNELREESLLVRRVFDTSLLRPLYETTLQAGYRGRLQEVLYFMLIIAGTTFFIGLLLGLSLPLAILLGLLMGYYLPYRHCIRAFQKRNAKFIDLFPDALDMIVRSVRSGFPLPVALQMLGETAESPVREEFREVTNDIALGRPLAEALSRLAVRINQPDIRFFVVVLSVQQETGGNLAEIIGNLSNIIRKRKQLRHKIKAMTSEGRTTAWVLGALPFLVFLALYVVQPSYLRPFWTDPIGMVFMAAVFGLIGACMFIVKQMINVDI